MDCDLTSGWFSLHNSFVCPIGYCALGLGYIVWYKALAQPELIALPSLDKTNMYGKCWRRAELHLVPHAACGQLEFKRLHSAPAVYAVREAAGHPGPKTRAARGIGGATLHAWARHQAHFCRLFSRQRTHLPPKL
jgi:hypothetical protein